jgi:Ca2+-binding EF-hand superfamily protein
MPPNVSLNPLIEKVMAEPDHAVAYRRHVQQILEDFFQPARLHAQVDAIAALIRDAIPGDALYPPEEFARAVGGVEARGRETEAPGEAQRRGGRRPAGWDRGPSLKDWITGRVESLQAQLDGKIQGTALSFSPGRPGGPGGRNGPPGMGLAGALGPPLHRTADTGQDRLVNRTELASFIRQGFTQIDADANGKVDEAELRKWLQASLPPPPEDRRPEGRPGVSNPLNSPLNRGDAPGQMLAPRLLREWDVDRNGVVTAEEAQHVADSAFDRRDHNHDGGLDLEEWMRWMESLVGPPPRASWEPIRASHPERLLERLLAVETVEILPAGPALAKHAS